MRLIDADELKRKMCYKCIDTDEETEKGRVKWDSGLWIRYKVFEDAVTIAPTVEAEPIRHGHWEHGKDVIGIYYQCSECGSQYHIGYEFNYCPECGAKMDEGNAEKCWQSVESVGGDR